VAVSWKADRLADWQVLTANKVASLVCLKTRSAGEGIKRRDGIFFSPASRHPLRLLRPPISMRSSTTSRLATTMMLKTRRSRCFCLFIRTTRLISSSFLANICKLSTALRTRGGSSRSWDEVPMSRTNTTTQKQKAPTAGSNASLSFWSVTKSRY
jgi:hypothetical protein